MTAKMTTKVTKISTPRKLPTIQYHQKLGLVLVSRSFGFQLALESCQDRSSRRCVANSGRVEKHSIVTDRLCSVHRVVYVIFYRRIRIPRISGNSGACADSVYQALLSPHEREPGFEAKTNDV